MSPADRLTPATCTHVAEDVLPETVRLGRDSIVLSVFVISLANSPSFTWAVRTLAIPGRKIAKIIASSPTAAPDDTFFGTEGRDELNGDIAMALRTIVAPDGQLEECVKRLLACLPCLRDTSTESLSRAREKSTATFRDRSCADG